MGCDANRSKSVGIIRVCGKSQWEDEKSRKVKDEKDNSLLSGIAYLYWQIFLLIFSFSSLPPRSFKNVWHRCDWSLPHLWYVSHEQVSTMWSFTLVLVMLSHLSLLHSFDWMAAPFFGALGSASAIVFTCASLSHSLSSFIFSLSFTQCHSQTTHSFIHSLAGQALVRRMALQSRASASWPWASCDPI